MQPITFFLFLSIIFSNTTSAESTIKDDAEDPMLAKSADQNSWYRQGDRWLKGKVTSLQAQSHSSDGFPAAKNIILFIGDGMSITTLTASRIWQGQQQGKLGEEHFLHFETFPHTALIKTYNSNQQTPDSAGTMSAIMTGVKTRAGVISIGPEQDRTECSGSAQHHQKTLLEWGHEQGFDTGIVTTARLTHATPAATYAHSPERSWEGDYDRHPNAYWYGCDSIAKQLVESAYPAGLDLALGGGGSRLKNYYASFKQQFPAGHLLKNTKDLLEWQAVTVKPPTIGPVLGVFSLGHMDYEMDRSDDQPSLIQMTKSAVQYLQGRDDKYLLVIESARIDHAHHKGNAARALAETAMLADSVQLADDMTNDADTLIIVTADHSHTFVMAGYPKRGNPILGISKNQKNERVLANDGLPYTTLGYANGKAYGRASQLQQLVHSEDKDFQQRVAVPLEFETHGSDDVALHAKGPGAYLFSGLMEQNEIFHTMLQALSSGNMKMEDSQQ
jgi:alkaline phosphatase